MPHNRTAVRLPYANAIRLSFAFAVVTACTAAMTLRAQVAINVTDTTGWNGWITPGETLMTDPAGDQQTGQGQDDIVGDSTYAAIAQKAGTIGGVDSIAWQVRMNKYDTKGFGGNFELGLDLDGNGSVDVVMKMSDKNGQTITFATVGAGANNSPSTTTWGSFTGSISLTGSTYNYQQAYDGSNFSGTGDAFVTFAISFANLQNAIRTYAAPAFSSFVVDYTTRISFIAFTSRQGNAINQDLFGTSGNANSSSTFAALDASTAQMTPYGIVPEPATYVQLAILLMVGSLLAYKRRRARPATKLVETGRELPGLAMLSSE
jgi:hypothetical protein